MPRVVKKSNSKQMNKHSSGKMGGKKNKFKPQKTGKKFTPNTSIGSSKSGNGSFKGNKGKVQFANKNTSMDSRKTKSPMQTPVQKRVSFSPKGTANSKNSVAQRKATPFPKGANNKKKMALPEEEDSIPEGMGSDEEMLSQSDVSFSDSGEMEEIDSFEESDINEDDFDESDESIEPIIEVEPPKKAKKMASPAANKTKQEPAVKAKKEPIVKAKQEPIVKAKQEPVVKAKKEPIVKAKQSDAKKKESAVCKTETVTKSLKREGNGVNAAEKYTIENDQKRLFVTNLPANVTDDEIMGLDKNIKDFVKLAAFRKRNCSVILVFADESAAEVSLPLLKTKKVRSGQVIADYVGHKNSRKNPQDLGAIIDTRLYVGNLGDQCSEANLTSIFTTASTISVPTQRRHSFGFVEFADSSTAMEAIKKHNYSVFKGEKMCVQFARAKPGENKIPQLSKIPAAKGSVKRNKVEDSESSAKRPKEEESESDDKESQDTGEDIGDIDSDEELDFSMEEDDDANSEGGDDLESFDEEED